MTGAFKTSIHIGSTGLDSTDEDFPGARTLMIAGVNHWKGIGEWPAYDWWHWSKYWDLNAWIDEDREIRLTAYPVIDGEIITLLGINIM
jgi:hypothetical protein